MFIFLTDIHEDIETLKVISKSINSFNAELICLGDITGYNLYCPNYFNTRSASECIKWVKNNCTKVICGNHDLFSIRKIPCISGYFAFPENWYELDYPTRERISNKKVWLYERDEFYTMLSYDGYRFLHSLPEFCIFEKKGLNILVSHYLFPDFSGSTRCLPEELVPLHLKYMKENNINISFVGHTHFSIGCKVISYQKEVVLPFGKSIELSNFPLIVFCPPLLGGKADSTGCVGFNPETRTLMATTFGNLMFNEIFK